MTDGAPPPRLAVLGGLALRGADLTRPKPLLLATYLALEGRQARGHLAELFFADAAHPRDGLAVALSRLRAAIGPALRAEGGVVDVVLDVDARRLLDRVHAGDLAGAEALYAGPFLEGADLRGVGAELEEWCFATRELLGGALRGARLGGAEALARAGDAARAAAAADRALRTPGAAEPEPTELRRALTLLRRGGHASAEPVAAALRGWGEVVPEHVPSEGAAGVSPAREAPGASERAATGAAFDLIGRDAELAAWSGELRDPATRVLTLVGPGGIGKTRLAQRLAADRAADGGTEVAFVPLEDVADAAQVVGRVAQLLGLDVGGAGPEQARLVRALGGRPRLVVLDNAETALAGVADLVAAAATAPEVRWLVTSREPLGLEEEQVRVVDGLALPDPADDPDRLRAAPAVALFLRRRRRSRAAPPDPEEGAAVARLCRAVGGWPLALEIAAALARVVPVAQLADELERRPDLLVHPDRPDPDRHRSMGAVLEASWARLAAGDREALARLSVFSGGFARAAAEAVAGVGLARLARLADRGLLRGDAGGRCALHPLVASFAAARLAPTERARLERAHAAWFAARLVEAEEALRGGGGRDATVAALAADHGNLRDAWRGAVRRGEDGVWVPATGGFARYLMAAGRARSAAVWLAEARTRATAAALGAAVHARVGLALGTALAAVARYDEAAAALAPALDSADPALRAEAHDVYGGKVAYWRGDFAEASAHLERAVDGYAALGDALGRARAAFAASAAAWAAGDLERAEAWLDDAHDGLRGVGDAEGEAFALSGRAVVAVDRGDLDAAARWSARAVAAAASLRSEHVRAAVACNDAHVRALRGDRGTAGDALRWAMDVFERVGDDPWLIEAASYLVRDRVAARDDAGARAAVRAGAEAALRCRNAATAALLVAAVAASLAATAGSDARALQAAVAARGDVLEATRRACAAAVAVAPSSDGVPSTDGGPSVDGGDLWRVVDDLRFGLLPSGRPLDGAWATDAID